MAHARTWTRVLADPIDDAILGIDRQERHIPAALRRLLLVRSPRCDGAGCDHSASGGDVDHRVRFEHHGPTAEYNLANLCRPMHQIKDEGYLHVRRRDDGALVWRTRWGASIVTKPARIVRRANDPPPF